MANSKLTNEQKTYAVQALACFDSPSTVAKALKEDFGVQITPQAIECYDPNKRAGRDLAQKWRAIFEETRKAFLEDTSQIGISHRAVRLRTLQRMAEKAETMGNMMLAKDLLEQAAKEVGNAYTNRRELAGPGGGPVQVRTLADFYGGASGEDGDT
ncbi:DUF2280 domain-containing protein [Leisingera methylohalidivorans]|uniref:DUF2280 domain-containing protein n=1 Tax=Leisingera methylohalidivorans DSM 14336 TaxID=999552 RepID=V9VUB0_9RHOB|nr:DUF2280 domain-containing protein [Leisingera methylohalidivorans]AHD00467.1 hypothetical protein METH_06810 [Leisingera methylohalidivorans DSM 14336]